MYCNRNRRRSSSPPTLISDLKYYWLTPRISIIATHSTTCPRNPTVLKVQPRPIWKTISLSSSNAILTNRSFYSTLLAFQARSPNWRTYYNSWCRNWSTKCDTVGRESRSKWKMLWREYFIWYWSRYSDSLARSWTSRSIRSSSNSPIWSWFISGKNSSGSLNWGSRMCISARGFEYCAEISSQSFIR